MLEVTYSDFISKWSTEALRGHFKNSVDPLICPSVDSLILRSGVTSSKNRFLTRVNYLQGRDVMKVVDSGSVGSTNSLRGVPREQKMLEGHLPRASYHQGCDVMKVTGRREDAFS